MIAAWLIYTIWPIGSFFSLTFLGQKHLIIITNEAEQRPCGGFITAYGELSFFPPQLTFHNSYERSETISDTFPSPLQTVTQALHFWDLGYETNLQSCTQLIHDQFENLSGKKISRVWLVNTQVFSDLLAVIGALTVEDKTVTTEHFFPEFSRNVAHTDRHDEVALSQRKNPLKQVLKTYAKTIIASPQHWRKTFKTLAQAEKNGDIFIQHWSQNFAPNPQQLQVIEWNLGGGKTSKSLWSKLTIQARETHPKNWDITLDLDVDNLSGSDEPLGQAWQGEWEIIFPTTWWQTPVRQKTSIAPGGTWHWHQNFTYQGRLDDVDIFVPRGQNLRTEIKISAYPQAILTSQNLNTFNNTATWQGLLTYGSNSFRWQSSGDTAAPFLTMHRPVSPESLDKTMQEFFAEENLIVEVHTNEKIRPDLVQSAQLIDRNVAVPERTENKMTEKILVFPDQTTILIGFSLVEKQINERFYLQLDTLQDEWGNTTNTWQNTVIIR